MRGLLFLLGVLVLALVAAMHWGFVRFEPAQAQAEAGAARATPA